jgi:hypothetical protein
MKQLVNNLKGDKVIWSFVALLALFSFMPVFSASSNLAYLGMEQEILFGKTFCISVYFSDYLWRT